MGPICPFGPIQNFSRNYKPATFVLAKYVIFAFLLYLVLLQSLKKILRVDPEIYDIWCFGTILGHFWAVTGAKLKISKKQKQNL